jgi:hypothetical protein
VAADNGIGFIDANNIAAGPQILLKDIEFTDVLAYENVALDSLEDSTTLVIYAISTHGELFVSEATRDPSGKRPLSVPSSISVPIRKGVKSIAGSINPTTGSFETVYVTRDSETLKLLTRDSESSLWRETEMIVNHEQRQRSKSAKLPAYIVSVSLTNGNGAPVPPAYKVLLSSSPVLVYINDRSYNLSRRPQEVPVNRYGQMQIVIPAGNSLGASPIHLKLVSREPRTFKIQPAQRVIHQLSQLKSVSDIRSARTPDNTPLLTGNPDEANVEKVAQVFSDLPNMLASVDADEDEEPSKDNMKQELVLAWQNDEKKTPTSPDWASGAVDAAGEVLGDLIEGLKQGVKAIVKACVAVAGPVVKLILQIGARVIRFVLTSVNTIVTGLATLLESYLGIDLSTIRQWVSFRYLKVEATRKVSDQLTYPLSWDNADPKKQIASLISNGLDVAARMLKHNEKSLEQTLDRLGQFIETNIVRAPEALPTTKESSEESKVGLCDSILNNPVVKNLLKFNPVEWVWEAINEDLGQEVILPTMDLGAGSKLIGALRKQFNILMKFFKRSWERIQHFMDDPQRAMRELGEVLRDLVKTIFEAFKRIILSLYSIVTSAFESIADFCRGEWKIPYLTELWEELTGCKFTLVNFVSYVTAQLLELGNPTSKPILENVEFSSLLSDAESKSTPTLFGEAVVTDAPVSPELSNKIRYVSAPKHSSSVSLHTNSFPQALAFSRIGQSLSRTAAVAIQGMSQGQSNASDGEKEDALKSEKPEDDSDLFGTLKDFVKDPDAADEPSAALSKDTLEICKVDGIKATVVGTNAFGLGCRAMEQFILLNYVSKEQRDAENVSLSWHH